MPLRQSDNLLAMESAKEAIEAARSWYRLGLIISVTTLILIFSPIKNDYYHSLNEAYFLRDLKIMDYEQFIRDITAANTLLPSKEGVASIDWSRNITDFLKLEMGQNVMNGDFPNPTWQIEEVVEYNPPPTDGVLEDWYEWVISTAPALYVLPDWTTAVLSSSRGDEGAPALVRHFSLRAPEFSNSQGAYSFRAYLERNITDDKSSQFVDIRANRKDWWSEIDQLDLQELVGDVTNEVQMKSDLGENRWVVEGIVQRGGSINYAGENSGVKHWLQQTGMWSSISSQTDIGETVFPAMRTHWSEVRDRSLAAAIALMESKQSEIQDINLLGLSVPGQLCVVAIPVAYLLIYLSLLIELRYITNIQNTRGLGDISVAPWVLFYQDRLAILVSTSLIVVVPCVLSITLLLRYYARVELYTIALGTAALIAAVVASFLSARRASAIRSKLKSNKVLSER